MRRVEVPTIKDERLARFVGAFLGDGWVRQAKMHVSGWSLGLAVGTEDEEHTYKYKSLCEGLFQGSVWSVAKRGAFGLSTSSKIIHTWLSDQGLGYAGRSKRVPNWIAYGSETIKVQFLSGFVDADGHVSENERNSGRLTIGLGSLPLTIQTYLIAQDLSMSPVSVRSSMQKTNFGSFMAFRFSVKSSTARNLDLWHTKKRDRLKV